MTVLPKAHAWLWAVAVSFQKGGVGFDYRFAMGVPDFWIRLIKQVADEKWHLGQLWYELTNRRRDEKTISYAESHDQALVGDQSLFFRLVGSDIYDHMCKNDENIWIDRGIANPKTLSSVGLQLALSVA